MVDTGVCTFCFDTPKALFKIPNYADRLIFSTVAGVNNLASLDLAQSYLKRDTDEFCEVHFVDVAKKLLELVDLKQTGALSSMGIRIIEMWFRLMHGVELAPGSMDYAIRNFLNLYSKDAAEIFQRNQIDLTAPSPPIEPRYQGTESLTHRCIQCGEEHKCKSPTIEFISKPHQKLPYTVFAGPCLTNLMNYEQAHAVYRLPHIPLCKEHAMEAATTLKTLEFKLLKEEGEEDFKKAVLLTFGKGMMDCLKAIICFAYRLAPHQKSQPSRCKFCQQTSDSVLYDTLLGVRAHWRCFTEQAKEIQYDMKTSTVEQNGFIKLRVPVPEEYENWKGAELENLLTTFRKLFGKRDLAPSVERIHVLVLFAKYWKHDENLFKRIDKEEKVINKGVQRQPRAHEDPDDVWKTLYR